MRPGILKTKRISYLLELSRYSDLWYFRNFACVNGCPVILKSADLTEKLVITFILSSAPGHPKAAYLSKYLNDGQTHIFSCA